MRSSSPMATTKMSMASFAILSAIGLAAQYGIVLSLILSVYGLLIVLLFVFNVFGFMKNPNSGLHRSLMVFLAPALASLVGVILAYFVLKDRKAI